MIKNLRLLREKHGVSQQKLAEAIGLTQQSINKYENHKIEPDIATLMLIADFSTPPWISSSVTARPRRSVRGFPSIG